MIWPGDFRTLGEGAVGACGPASSIYTFSIGTLNQIDRGKAWCQKSNRFTNLQRGVPSGKQAFFGLARNEKDPLMVEKKKVVGRASGLLRFFRIVGLFEALSFLILLGIAMPLKYMGGLPEATKHIGMAHGLLFLAYVILASQIAAHDRWPFKQLFMAYIAAVLPFGTIVFDRKFLAENS